MSPADELTCQQVVELVTAYDEGALADDVRRRFEEHLGSCDACVTYCDQLRHAGQIACRLAHEHDAPLEPALEAMLLAVLGVAPGPDDPAAGDR